MPAKIWQKKEWTNRRQTFLQDKKCEWCGVTENLVIHHSNYLNPNGSSISDEQYLDWDSSDVIVLCRKCHTNHHKGYVLCKKCSEHWHNPKYESCWNCFIQTPQGQATADRIVEEQYEDAIVKETNPICGKVFEIERWRLERHGELSSFCYIICGDAYTCEMFQRWDKGELPEDETYNPQYFKDIREFEEKIDQLMEQGLDYEEAVEKLLKEQTE